MRHGFSLVELSIVLVILGLLVGGILGGQSLIRAAELRSITTDLSKFQTAVNAFRGKYDAIPGDMTNATDYWGAANATPATCQTTQGTGTQTCNGNGDGKITQAPSSASYNYEMWRAWQHLANAGLVEGSFSGIASAGATAGVNVPASKIRGGVYVLMNRDENTDSFYFAASPLKHIIQLGDPGPVGGYGAGGANYPLLPVDEGYGFDAKIDDGKPGTGNVRSLTPGSGFGSTCASTDSSSTAAYLLGTAGNCQLIFKLGF